VVLAVRFCSLYFAAVPLWCHWPPLFVAVLAMARIACPLLTTSPGHARFIRSGGIEKKMEITLPLENMTIAEKLRVMETLWRDLTRDEEQLESPKWHGEVLRERAARVEQGKESFMDWETAKTQLRNRVK
jgi:hypothetical protein